MICTCNVLLGETGDVLHETFFVQAHQADGRAVGAGPTGTADAVHIVFADIGDVVVHDVRQVVDVDAAGRNVGGHQCADVTALETAQCLGAAAWLLLPCSAIAWMPFLVRNSATLLAPNLVRVNTSTWLQLCSLMMCASSAFFLPRPTGWMVCVMRCTVVLRGVTCTLCGFFSKVAARSRISSLNVAENSRLCLSLGQHCQHLFDVVDEAHVEHAVGFVQHQHLNLTQVQHTLLQQVEQATRCGHQNVDTRLDTADLRIHADAAKNHGRRELQELAVGLDRLLDLGSQFAGGGEHQGADTGTAEFVLCATRHAQLVQHGQNERGGLASSGLGAAQQVVARQDYRDGLGLDGRWGLVALLAHSLDDGRSQIQIFKVHYGCGTRPGRLACLRVPVS